MAISEFEVSAPSAQPTIETPGRLGPVALRINNARAEGAILAGRLDDPRLDLIRQHQELSAKLGDTAPSPDFEHELRAVVSQGIRQHGIHLDRLSALFGDQLRDQSTKQD